MNWKDIGVRAGRTFLQAFIAVIVMTEISSVADLVDPSLLDQAAVAGIAAALSFAQSVLADLTT